MSLLPLAPVDYVFTGNMSCPVTFAFTYDELLDPIALQQSLDALLEHIPALGGSLRTLSDCELAYEVPARPQLVLEVTTTQKLFAELADTEVVRLVRSTDDEPLVHARLTQTPNGSVLAVSMSHALVDGFSFFLMMSNWASCARGLSVTTPPMARLLQPTHAQVAAAASELTASSILDQSGMFWSERRPEVPELPVQDCIHLSSAELADLIADAQRGVDAKLRQNDVLTAWLWREYGSQWWAGQTSQDVFMSCPVDVRRLLGEANKCLFGCTITAATIQASYTELLEAPLGELALRVQGGVASVFTQGCKERVAPLEALRREHGVAAMESVHLRHPQLGMLVTNMSRLPLAELDFGHGTPTSVKLYTEMDSMAAVLPAADGVTLGVYHPLPRAA